MSLVSRTFRWIGAAVFTVLVPGTVTVFLPYYFLDQSVPGIGNWGPIQLAVAAILVEWMLSDSGKSRLNYI